MTRTLLTLCVSFLMFHSFAQDTEFWFAPPTSYSGNVYQNNGGFIFSNTSPRTATVTIHHFKTDVDSVFQIPPNGSYHLKYGNTSILANLQVDIPDAGVVTPAGVHITSDEKVLGYYFFDVQSIKDLYSLKGENALGTEFYLPQSSDGYWLNQLSTLYDHAAIIATEDGTTIRFTPTRECDDGGMSAGGFMPGVTYERTLNTGDMFILKEHVIGTANVFNTLAGTHITSDKPISVTTDESCTGADEIGDQIVPVDKLGTLYTVLKGYTTAGKQEHIYILATADGTDVTVTEPGGNQVSLGTINAGQSAVYNMGDRTAPPYAVSIQTSLPAYVYQITAAGGHPAGALIPSVQSIGQSKFSFFQIRTTTNDNGLMLMYRDTCDIYFTINYDNITDTLVNASGTPAPGVTIDTPDSPVPGIPGWNYMRLHLPIAANEKTVTIQNSESSFSLGYYSGDTGSGQYCAFGYLSGFGEFEFDPDTIWRCVSSNPGPVTLIGGYGQAYRWTLPDGSTLTTPTILARQAGRYILEMDQDFRTSIDTIWVLDIAFNAEITKRPGLPKPVKVGVPQQFGSTVNAGIPELTYRWSFEGGTPATSDAASPTVTWNSTGLKQIMLTLTAKGTAGKDTIVCDTTIIMDLIVKPKHNGYFVDQHVNGGRQDGSDWQNAFTKIEEALNLASQGDYVWVAKGEYNPPTDGTYRIDYDSVQVYGGFAAWENKLNERDFAANPTIINGRNNAVVTFDGSNTYTNGSCGVGTGAVLDGFIIQNGQTDDGAGIRFINGASGTVSNCIVRNNTARRNGGGIYIASAYTGCVAASSDPVFFNVEVSGNNAAQGAGIHNNGSDFFATNITVGGNRATETGGLYNNGGDPEIRNSILWSNRDASAKEGAMDVTATGIPVYTYSIVGGSNGSGNNWNVAIGADAGRNTDVNPLFQRSGFDEYGEMQQGNYRLTATSKAVNTGRNPFVLSGNHLLKSITLLKPVDSVYTPTIPNDLAGGNRIEYDVVDRGAYEYTKGDGDPLLVHEVLIPDMENISTDPDMGLYWVRAHDSFELTLFPKQGYNLENIVITTGSKWQDERGGMKVVHNQDGSVTVTFREVSDPLNVQITGESPVSNERIDHAFAIRTTGGKLYIKTTNAGALKVYTLTGTIILQQQLAEGETGFPLAKGAYIVTFDDGYKQKVVVK